MDRTTKITIYGDSIMKGTILDDKYRYHSIGDKLISDLENDYAITAENRARFGITICKGSTILDRDIAGGRLGDYAIVEFGGNDCNFDWHKVAEDPEGEHQPFTQPNRFVEIYTDMVRRIREYGATPVLVTLPPIDAQKFIRFIERGGSNMASVMRWLGDVNMLYRFHESYSNMVQDIAKRMQTKLVDVRRRFLQRHNFTELTCCDGLHPSCEGYRLIAETFAEFIGGGGLRSAL